jgi:hypothetical protein
MFVETLVETSLQAADFPSPAESFQNRQTEISGKLATYGTTFKGIRVARSKLGNYSLMSRGTAQKEKMEHGSEPGAVATG